MVSKRSSRVTTIAACLFGITVISASSLHAAPAATNLSAPETYVEDAPCDLTDIVVTDAVTPTTTVMLTLSDAALGTLSTATSGTTTSTFNPSTGAWSASGPLAEVNTLLAGVSFVPAPNVFADLVISTLVTDGVATPILGTKMIDGTSVNDAPSASALSAAQAYTEDTTLGLTDIIVTDVDNGQVGATLTLSSASVGTLSTATSGAVTSTFANGEWEAVGPLADVNALLAGVTFTPAANVNISFTIGTSVSDGMAAALTGTKVMTGSAVNDPPSAADDATALVEGTSVEIIIDGNDMDIDDGLALDSVTFVSAPLHGLATITGVTITYRHDGTATRTDSLSYTISDEAGATSNVATVTFTITPPVVEPDDDDDDGGCGCSSGGSSVAASWPLLLGLVQVMRRRRRR